MSQDIIINSCIQLIGKEGRPFNLLDSSAFRAIVEPIFNSLEMNIINSHNIMHYVVEAVEKEKKKITKLCKKKLLVLKIDAATRLERSVLGINLQTIQGKIILVKTLGMVEIKSRHTAINLRTEILNVLSTYDISVNQIYSITTDNGRNMVKAVQILRDDESEEDETDLWPILDELKLGPVLSVRCAAHTLQLAIYDVLKDAKLSELIETVRDVVKILRTPTYK